MADRDVVARKIASATARLGALDELLGRPRDEFLDDTRGRDLAAFYLQLAIQDCIDLASHWVSEAGWPPPDDAGSAFDALAEHDLIPSDVATVLHDAVSLRHRIAHGYALIDHGRLYDEALEGRAFLTRFLALMANASGL